MSGDAVLFEVDGSVAVITINRPERRNALGRDVREGLWSAFEVQRGPITQRGDPDGLRRQGVLCRHGSKEASETALGFPAGKRRRAGHRAEFSVSADDAAVNGVAMAGGWLMAQMCDPCVAAEGALRHHGGKGWSRHAVAVPLMTCCRSARGAPHDRRCALGRASLQLGYLNRVVPREADGGARELAQRIADNAPLTVRACRQMVLTSPEQGRSDALAAAHRLFEPVYNSLDAQEGPRAFAEKRRPAWQGR